MYASFSNFLLGLDLVPHALLCEHSCTASHVSNLPFTAFTLILLILFSILLQAVHVFFSVLRLLAERAKLLFPAKLPVRNPALSPEEDGEVKGVRNDKRGRFGLMNRVHRSRPDASRFALFGEFKQPARPSDGTTDCGKKPTGSAE